MAEQVQLRKPEKTKETEETITDEELAKAKNKANGEAAVKSFKDDPEELDSLLDTIEEVLEENAAALAVQYEQTGGQ